MGPIAYSTVKDHRQGGVPESIQPHRRKSTLDRFLINLHVGIYDWRVNMDVSEVFIHSSRYTRVCSNVYKQTINVNGCITINTYRGI